MISLIAGVAKNGVIGNKNELPWHIKEDLQRFKVLTLGKPVIMGRKTFESIIMVLGKPLPGRTNIIVTTNVSYKFEGCVVCNSIGDALKKAKEISSEIYVIGGQKIYEQTIKLADKLEITSVHKNYEGDAYFPKIDESWQESKREDKDSNGITFSFITYERKKSKKIVGKSLKDVDFDSYILIRKEKERQQKTINLIPSENYASEAVMEASGTSLINKYAEGYPHKRYYQGNNVVDEVEDLAIERAKKIFGAEHVNVQSYSGSPANFAVFLALLAPGDKFMGLDLGCGGHLTHGSPVNFSGQIYKQIPYTVDKETGLLNMKEIREIALREKPKMIISGLSAYPRIVDFKAFQDIAEEVGAVHLADISHIAGLVAAGVHPSPFPFTDVVTTTTHKTLRGPRGAIIMCKEKYAKQIDKAVFPGCQGGPHMNSIAAKAVAFKEALSDEFKEYGQQIVKNAKVLAHTLSKNGIKLVTGGTENHLILVDLRDKGIGLGKQVAVALEEAGIVLNANSVPFDTSTPFKPSGVRLGTPMVTTRGMKESEMEKIGNWISAIIRDVNNSELKAAIKRDVEELCAKFPIYN